MKNSTLQENLEILEDIEKLEDNWNDYGASKFNKDFIDKVKSLLNDIKIQPKIFPTSRKSIQFEYYYNKYPERYCEFEIFKDKIKLFINYENNSFTNIFDFNETAIYEINNFINKFYE